VSDRAPIQAGVEPFASEETRQEFVRLLGGALATFLCTQSPGSTACLKDGKGNSEADEPETLFENYSACSNFSFDLAGSTDIERKEDS
jgi:hypothetical protein